MGYYIGTLEDCEAYDQKISKEERYTGDVTSRWAEVRQHPDGSKYAIAANNSIEPQEDSNLIFEVQLSEDWTPEEEL
jgi:hypothetical protein